MILKDLTDTCLYVAYQNDVYYKRFFEEYCIVGIPHNTAM